MLEMDIQEFIAFFSHKDIDVQSEADLLEITFTYLQLFKDRPFCPNLTEFVAKIEGLFSLETKALTKTSLQHLSLLREQFQVNVS